ncbi:MAG TPA: hypothetical protein VHD60_01105 [Candidatus Saccharimonadales bacterium]|nr:hypothetical protein [Candidatus Saccharimonadales bacterium]
MKSVGTHVAGYTIVEVMIFLAVSGAMFLIAAVFINGRQAAAEFSQATGDISTQLQQVINNVINGYYPSQENFSCQGGDVNNGPTFPNAAKGKGTNKGCIFIGEVVQFGVAGTQGAGYNVIPVVGNQTVTDTTTNITANVTSFAQAHPTPLTPDSYTAPAHINAVNKHMLLFGMHATKMFLVSGNTKTPISGFGVFTSFGSYNSSGLLNSGAQDVMITTVPGLDSISAGYPTYGGSNAASTDIANMDDSTAHPYTTLSASQSVVICLQGGNNKPASVSLGNSKGSLSVTSQAESNIAAACIS